MASVDTIKRDLVKTIDAMKKNLEKYKNAKDENARKRHAKIAYKLQDKKKKLQKELDIKIAGLYANAELELKEFRKVIRKTIIKNLIEADVFSDPNIDMSKVFMKGVGPGGEPNPDQLTDEPEKEVEDALKDFERDIKKTDLAAEETEAIGLTLAGVALSLPEIIKLIGKFVNLLKKVPGLKSLSGDKLIEVGDKYHKKISGAFEYIIKKAGVADPVKAKKFANIIHHIVIAMLLVAGGISMKGLLVKGNLSGTTIKAALNAIKAKEIRAFIISSANALT
tara:strand:+ start:651 stop:1490 length:840 start_codon:yes stop_codon:yes gene_type:complete